MRPFLPKMLAALEDYAKLTPEGRYQYRLVEIAQKHGVSQPALSRAAKKKGLSRYLTR